jgi:CubicO group peptidase (beta-lactamase class C family)
MVAAGYALNRGDGATAAAPWTKQSCKAVVLNPRFAAPVRAVRRLVPRMKEAFAAPGLQMAVAVDGKVVWSEVCGFADVQSQRPVTRTTLFRIGSVSKPFTGTALARLFQAGKVELDAPVQRLVPEFRAKQAVTLRHLAAHQGGVRHYVGAEALGRVHYKNLAAALTVFATDPLLFRPGTDFLYSSYGFNLIGLAIERIEHAPYAQVLRREVLAPLGLTRTGLDGPRRPDTASFYEVTGDRSAVPAPAVDLSNRYPSGGLVSTAEETARFGSKIGNPAFLTADVQAIFFKEQQLPSGKPTGTALGWEVGESPAGVFVGHTGNVVGGTAFILSHPASRVAIAMTTNVGWVTAPTPPELGPAVPQPPQLLVPFIKAVTQG